MSLISFSMIQILIYKDSQLLENPIKHKIYIKNTKVVNSKTLLMFITCPLNLRKL